MSIMIDFEKKLQFWLYHVRSVLVFFLKVFLLLVFMLVLIVTNSAQASSSAAARTANIELEASALAQSTTHKRIKPVKIITSIRPLALILTQLISEKTVKYWDLQVIVPPQSSVHDYQFKPSDLVKLKSSDMLFWLGPQMEPNIAKGVARFGSNNSSLESSAVRWRALDHKGHDHHGHEGVLDPHIWLSLPQMPTILKFMADQLSTLLQERAMLQERGWSKKDIQSQYQQLHNNLQAALKSHRKMSQKIKRLQSTWVNHRYITFHNGFGYLDEAFNVRSMGSFVNTPEDGIAPRQIRHLQNVIQSEEIGCLILEPTADGRRVASLLDEKLPIVDIDILGNALPGGLDWRGFWEYIAEQMQVCFGSPSIEVPKESIHDLPQPVRKPMQRQEQRILNKL